jgi:O-methyltransferase involved in polyketide biosynthesis
LPTDKSRIELFEQLNAECKKALVITEGLVIYLTAEQVAELATDLSSQTIFVAGFLILFLL